MEIHIYIYLDSNSYVDIYSILNPIIYLVRVDDIFVCRRQAGVAGRWSRRDHQMDSGLEALDGLSAYP